MGIQRSGILKKFKDADPADFHHAREWKERQKSRIQGLRSRLLMWRLSPESMRDDLENILLLFRFVGNGFQLALCNVSWLATRESHCLRARGPCCSTEAPVTAVKTCHALWCCASFVPCPITSPPEGRSRRDNEGTQMLKELEWEDS